jgi:hypothetical protein
MLLNILLFLLLFFHLNAQRVPGKLQLPKQEAELQLENGFHWAIE